MRQLMISSQKLLSLNCPVNQRQRPPLSWLTPEEHLSQLIATVPHLADKCIIIIDDTKLLDDLTWWGKGALAVPFLLDINYTIIASSDDGVALCSPSFLQP